MQVNEKYSIYVRGGTFKRGDTMRHIVISFQDEQGCWVTPNPDHTFVAKVANSTGYIGDYPVAVVDSDFIISTKAFAKLPDDQYELEIWEIWPSDGDEEPDKTIYPTPETVAKFTIEANVTDKVGEVIKKIGFQDVVNAAVENAGLNLVINAKTVSSDEQATVEQQYEDGKNHITFSIPAGPKGDTGTVDNAGLTTAPAFVNLQTQVNNSAVGTNLLTNTSNFSSNWGGIPVSTTTEYNGHPSMVLNSSNHQKALQFLALGKLENSFQYTCSFWAKADNAGDKAHTELWGGIGAADFVLTTNWVRYTVVLTSLPDANTNYFHSMYSIQVPAENKGNVYIALPKLEKGNVATDWCPNPSEILTQADYAKLQAAIVALGGSLK